MRYKKIVLAAILFLGLILLGFSGVSHGEEAAPPPTATIGFINGPADVGATTIPTETTIFVDVCLNVNSVGQTEYGFEPCELPTTTTTIVQVGEPPTQSFLPTTGAYTYSFVFILLGAMLVIFGVLLTCLRRH